MKKILIIIPAYNEEESIIHFLEDVNNYIDESYQVLIIDDGSKDNTVKLVKEYGNNVKIISQLYNLGYGSALQLGYKYASENGYDYVMQMDADGQHDAVNIKKMRDIIDSSDDADIIIGSRFLKGSVTFKISVLKKIAMFLFRKIIRITSKQKVTDPTSGLQCLNKSAFSYYAGYNNFDYQYPDANMIIQMCIKGYKIKEFPAIMHVRKFGTSMHSGIWKPFVYMIIMTLSIFTVFLREKDLKKK